MNMEALIFGAIIATNLLLGAIFGVLWVHLNRKRR